MKIQPYETMKETFGSLVANDSMLWLVEANPIYNVVCDCDEKTIWAGWRSNTDEKVSTTIYYDITLEEAKNFNKQMYFKIVQQLLLKFKQKQIEQKIEQINEDFK